MSKRPATDNPADLLREITLLEEQERALKERKRALAEKLREAAQKLDGPLVVARPKRKAAARPARRPKPAAPFVPLVTPPTIDPPPGRFAKREGTSWPDTMQGLIEAENRGIPYGELKALVMTTHLGPILERTDKAFYGTLAKLEQRKIAKRHGGRVYSAAAYAKFRADVDAGLVEDHPVPAGTPRQSPLQIAFLALLDERPRGVPTATVIAKLDNRADLNTTGKYSRNVIYNLISRLAHRGEIVRENGICRKADTSEAPDVPSGASKMNFGLLDDLLPKGRA
jgi:uncharacterized protein (UPF0147 family)